ncbi:hypothetical protein [Desulfovibrio ferrophilus]|uniref:DUF106 domain-containing protein n=1 Tax=Desulfovibrio ferrophilus TaxID=241368 RepID=A0A2Z6AUH5_9BACT|nr:hypothetical protein [Desulfovibrio ferrophilus]BBD06878.1 putative uncharacterized protein [Desulfovibrio ferrophilus]
MNINFIEIDQALDVVLIWLFRLPLPPLVSFFAGLVLLALILTIIGELCMAGVYFMNRKHFAEITHEMTSNNNASIRALARKDKKSYTACNSLANEAFGRSFFSGLALFASSVWPVAFALSWMQFRFGNIEFFSLPFAADPVGVNFVFIPLYVVVRFAFAKAKPYLPVFAQIKRAVKANEFSGEELMTWGDLVQDDKAQATEK